MVAFLTALAAVLTVLVGGVAAGLTWTTRAGRKLRHAAEWADKTMTAIRDHNRLVHECEPELRVPVEYPAWTDLDP